MRSRLLLVLTVMTVMTVALGLAPAAGAAPADWDELGLAHAEQRQIHFRGNAMSRESAELSAIAVAADSAVVMWGLPGQRRNRLVELPAGTEEPRTIGRRVEGIPMADVTGRQVFWTSRSRGEYHLHSYDTGTGTRDRLSTGRTPRVVFAVDGDTAYVQGPSWSTWRTWTAGAAGLEKLSTELPAVPLVTDVSGGTVAVFDMEADEGVSIIGPDGTTLAAGLQGWATFDATASHVSLVGEWGVGVWDLARGQLMRLRGLEGRRWFAPVWAPNGELVVTTYTSRRDERSWDDANPVRHYRCAMTDAAMAACTVVPTQQPHPTALDPVFGATALDQLLASYEFD